MTSPSRPLCQCGCGEPAPIAKTTKTAQGQFRGQPQRFIRGHALRQRGAAHPAWRGGVTRSTGYIKIHRPDHPRASGEGYVAQHILIAEAALGRPLPRGAEVHHVNGVRDDNRPENLVVCENHAYHFMLHRRARALAATGHADWMRCNLCHSYDSPEKIVLTYPGGGHHEECERARGRARMAKKRAARKAASDVAV